MIIALGIAAFSENGIGSESTSSEVENGMSSDAVEICFTVKARRLRRLKIVKSRGLKFRIRNFRFIFTLACFVD